MKIWLLTSALPPPLLGDDALTTPLGTPLFEPLEVRLGVGECWPLLGDPCYRMRSRQYTNQQTQTGYRIFYQRIQTYEYRP